MGEYGKDNLETAKSSRDESVVHVGFRLSSSNLCQGRFAISGLKILLRQTNQKVILDGRPRQLGGMHIPVSGLVVITSV
jgi:hypothetical protein